MSEPEDSESDPNNPHLINQVLVESSPSADFLKELNVDSWLLLRESRGEYERQYEIGESSYIIEGSGEVQVTDGLVVPFQAGDIVTVMPHTDCTWKLFEDTRRRYFRGE